MINSTLRSEVPSLLLCEVAVDRAISSLGMRRRLMPDFLSELLSKIPVFWTTRGDMRKLWALSPRVILPADDCQAWV